MMGEQVSINTEPMPADVISPVIPGALELAVQKGVIETAPDSPLALAIRRRTGEIASGAAVSVGHDSSLF